MSAQKAKLTHIEGLCSYLVVSEQTSNSLFCRPSTDYYLDSVDLANRVLLLSDALYAFTKVPVVALNKLQDKELTCPPVNSAVSESAMLTNAPYGTRFLTTASTTSPAFNLCIASSMMAARSDRIMVLVSTSTCYITRLLSMPFDKLRVLELGALTVWLNTTQQLGRQIRASHTSCVTKKNMCKSTARWIKA